MEKGMVNRQNWHPCEGVCEVGLWAGVLQQDGEDSAGLRPQLGTTGSGNFPCGVGGTIHGAESGWTAHYVKRPSPISTRANMSW